MTELYADRREKYGRYWSCKTDKQIENELASFRRYVDKHGQAYAWHGAGMTPSGCLADGDKIEILKNILKSRAEKL